jgi:hypothetical protein
MNSSLEIIRDQNGYFRHPNGYPLVVIFDSKHGEDKAPDEISWQEPLIGLHTHAPEEGEIGSYVLLWQRSLTYNTDTILMQSKKSKVDKQPRKFVNISHPAAHDRRTKKLIRTHVIPDLQRRKRAHESSVSKSFNVGSASAHNPTLCKEALRSNSEESASQATSIPRQPFVLLDPFATFPVNMEPYMYTLIHRCKCYSPPICYYRNHKAL